MRLRFISIIYSLDTRLAPLVFSTEGVSLCMEVFSMGRLLTAYEKAAYQQELDRAAVEGRDPQWKSMADFLKQGLTEEDIVWGSDSMKAYGRKGRYEANGTDAESDKDQGLKPTGRESTVYKQTLPDDPGVTSLEPDKEKNPPEHYYSDTAKLAKALADANEKSTPKAAAKK